MRGIKTLGGIESKTKGGVLGFAFLFTLSGGYGIFRFASSIKNSYFNVQVAALVSVAICAVMWLVFSLSRRFFWLLTLGALIGALAASFIRNVFWQQMVHVAKSLLGISGSAPIDITLLVTVFACLFSCFVLALELTFKGHWIAYFVTTGLMLFSPFTGITLDYRTIIMLSLFQLGFWVIHVSKKKYCAEELENEIWDSPWIFGFQKKKIIDYKVRLTSLGQTPKLFLEKINIATMVLFVAAALIALILMSNYHESIYRVVYKADGYIVRAIKKMYEEDAQTVDGGMISLGNLYPAGTKHLLVETDRQPKQTLYLRGFKGGNYIRDFWSAADDNALYKIINKKIDWDAQDIPIRFWYDGMYYTLNHMSHQDSSSMSLRIMRLLDGYTSYEPYYSERIPLLFLGGESPRYEYVFFEQADMDVDVGSQNFLSNFQQKLLSNMKAFNKSYCPF